MRISGHRPRAVWRGLLGVVLLAGLVLARPGFALDPQRRVSQYSQDSWRSDDGLPQNSLLALAQTRDGYVWLGTWEGLVRFDGARFVVFDKRNTPELRSHAIKALAEDASGVLWVGTDQGLVAYVDGRFQRAPGASAPLEGVRVEELLVGEGSLWVGTSGGLWQVPLGEGVARHFTEADGLPGSFVTAIARAGGDNRLWVGTKAGVALLEGGQVLRTPFPVPGPDPHPGVTALYQDVSGTLWMGTESGLFSWNGAVVTRFTVAEGLPAIVTALFADSQGSLWVGTRRGGLVRREADGFSAPLHGAGLADAEVLSLLEDRDGSLWVGTYSGLFRLRDGPFATYGGPEGLANETVSTVLEDRRGTVWFGTVGGGLFYLRDGRIHRMEDFEGGTDPVITALHEAPDGTLWAGSKAGAFRYDGHRFARSSRVQGLPDDVVTSILVDSRGTQWFGTRKGLARVRGGDVMVFGPRQGLGEPVIVMAEDAAGAVWLGSEGGLWRFEEGKGLRRYTLKDGLPGEVVLSLLTDPDGTVWVGTETGLGRWRNGEWTRYSVSQHGLYDDAVFSIVSDGDGYLWMSSNKGVSRVSRRELDEVADGRRSRLAVMGFDQTDGMRSPECNGNTQPSGWRGKDGRLWFTTIQGAIVVDPVRVRASRQPPEVRIEEVRVQGQLVPVKGPVELRPDGSRLDIRFTAFTPGDAVRLPFRYRLVGHDDGWVRAEIRRATYTGLRPGRYRFEVQAEGRDGGWTEPVSLEVLLEPNLWQRTDFWALFVLGLGMLGVSVYLLRVGQLKARERWLEERVQERTRELARANEELEANVRTLRQTQAQLVQAGRMAAVGQLAAGVGHEINNPLAYIVSNLEHASEESDALARELGEARDAGTRLREVGQALREALHGADRVRRIVRDLKTFSRPDDEMQGPVELGAVLDSAVKIAMGELRPRAKVVRDYGDVTWVEGSEARLAQVFLNLLINAAQALPEGRAEENEVRLVTRAGPEGWVVAEVRDTGTGISPESLGRIFDPFYTTKPVGVGTGLGLSLCHAYVTAMGGTISVESELGRGSVFRVALRRARDAGAAMSAEGRRRGVTGSRSVRGTGERAAYGEPGRASSSMGYPAVPELLRGVTERQSSPTGYPSVSESSRGVTERPSSPTGYPAVPESSQGMRAAIERQSSSTGYPVVVESSRGVTQRKSSPTGYPTVPESSQGMRGSTEHPSAPMGSPAEPESLRGPTPHKPSSREHESAHGMRGLTEHSSSSAGHPAEHESSQGWRGLTEQPSSTSYSAQSEPSQGMRGIADRKSSPLGYPTVPESHQGARPMEEFSPPRSPSPAATYGLRVSSSMDPATSSDTSRRGDFSEHRQVQGPPSSASPSPEDALSSGRHAVASGPRPVTERKSSPTGHPTVAEPSSGTRAVTERTSSRHPAIGESSSGSRFVTEYPALTGHAPSLESSPPRVEFDTSRPPSSALAEPVPSFRDDLAATRADLPGPVSDGARATPATHVEPNTAQPGLEPSSMGETASAHSHPGPTPARAPSTTRPRGRVLVVDDDALVSGAIRRTLARENDVDVVVSARQALERLSEPAPRRYDVVLCDLMMPEMTGMDLYDALVRTAPAVAERVVFITGGAFTPTARTFLERVENPRVEKPFDPEALRGLIRAEVARARGDVA
ncbi:two-component regulator propeller domain-containing protein [Myxococcus landrumensis]|nr:two-component regulator propeller domain-containing protein [Myxococcus landrumus]